VPDEQLRVWEARGSIEWIGLRDDMPEVLRQSNIVALPTTYGEGVPKILLEAAAAGRAIIANDVPGCREIVLDGVTGLLVPPNDTKGLADALRELLRDPARRRAMGLAGRQLAEREFDEALVARRTIAVYRRLLDARPPESIRRTSQPERA
jgi:glycosyltransferase involved in cell wall biosynthesis